MRKVILVLSLLAAACGEQSSKVEQTSANNAIAPQKILYPDIEANELYGLSCAFVPDGGGIGAIALAMPGGGYLKLDGKIVKLEPANPDQDIGPPQMAFHGDEQSFTLSLDEASFRRDGIETATYDAQLSITDKGGGELYSASGMAQCGA
jgi:hypothetical protein